MGRRAQPDRVYPGSTYAKYAWHETLIKSGPAGHDCVACGEHFPFVTIESQLHRHEDMHVAAGEAVLTSNQYGTRRVVKL